MIKTLDGIKIFAVMLLVVTGTTTLVNALVISMIGHHLNGPAQMTVCSGATILAYVVYGYGAVSRAIRPENMPPYPKSGDGRGL